ncbi:MAG: gamma-glutamylcyclotransferase family protein [Isosphaeraceae bacterium]
MRKSKISLHLYFLYGGCMSLNLIAPYCPSARVVAVARLLDYRLSFFGRSERWDGGEEGLVPQPGADVYGVVVQISRSDSDRLDTWQGVKLDGSGRYFHSPAEVIGLDGTIYPVLIFHKLERGRPSKPSTEYLEQIITGALTHQLPAGYVAMLRKVDSVPASYRVPRVEGFASFLVVGGGCSC